MVVQAKAARTEKHNSRRPAALLTWRLCCYTWLVYRPPPTPNCPAAPPLQESSTVSMMIGKTRQLATELEFGSVQFSSRSLSGPRSLFGRHEGPGCSRGAPASLHGSSGWCVRLRVLTFCSTLILTYHSLKAISKNALNKMELRFHHIVTLKVQCANYFKEDRLVACFVFRALSGGLP